jgi:hypothetical protein
MKTIHFFLWLGIIFWVSGGQSSSFNIYLMRRYFKPSKYQPQKAVLRVGHLMDEEFCRCCFDALPEPPLSMNLNLWFKFCLKESELRMTAEEGSWEQMLRDSEVGSLPVADLSPHHWQ